MPNWRDSAACALDRTGFRRPAAKHSVDSPVCTNGGQAVRIGVAFGVLNGELTVQSTNCSKYSAWNIRYELSSGLFAAEYTLRAATSDPFESSDAVQLWNVCIFSEHTSAISSSSPHLFLANLLLYSAFISVYVSVHRPLRLTCSTFRALEVWARKLQMVRNVSNLNAGEPIWSKHTKDVHDDPALVLRPKLRLELRTQIRAQTSTSYPSDFGASHLFIQRIKNSYRITWGGPCSFNLISGLRLQQPTWWAACPAWFRLNRW